MSEYMSMERPPKWVIPLEPGNDAGLDLHEESATCEAMRGYESSDLSRQYAANYRWLVELMDAGRRVTADVH